MSASAKNLIFERGEVIRVATSTLAYVFTDESKKILSFGPNQVAEYEGGDFYDLGLAHGSEVDVRWHPTTETIELIEPLASPSFRSTSDTTPDIPRPEIPPSSGPRFILRPEAGAKEKAPIFRAVSRETRHFGKLVDCTPLQPGDLMLTHDLEPDQISDLISAVQKRGGYDDSDARWTHAAMYLGDSENVVEATFESLASGGSVRITSLDSYCTGKHELRFRRSKQFTDKEQGWRLCVRALSRLKQPYDFKQAAKLWWDVIIRKTGFFDGRNRQTTSKAVICSTLYAEAYNEAFRTRLGEIGGVCVPAWLSVSDEFVDLDVSWSRF